jgi:putative inorganic carbon (hco3(-)) transporter
VLRALAPAKTGLLAKVDRRALALAGLVLVVSLPLAVLPLPVAAMLVAGTALGAIILARPQVGLYLLVFSVPYESLYQVNLGGAALGSTEALAGLLGVSWAARLATDRARPPARAALAAPLILVLSAVGLAMLRAVNLPLALKEFVRWFEVLLVYVVAANMLDLPRRRAVLLALLFLAGVSEALLGLFQFLFRWGPENFRTGGFLRAYGTFGQPNPYAGYLGMLLPLALALAVFGWYDRAARQRLPFWLLLGALVLIGAAFAASMSRGAWLGFALAVAVMAALASRRAFLAMLGAALAGAFVFTLGALELLPAQIAQRLTQIVAYFGVFDVRTVELTPANWAIVERMAVWQAAWGMFEAYPFLGVGPGNYSAAYQQFAMPGWPHAMGHAHNLYLNFLAETGAIGLFAFLVFWLSAIVLVWRSHRALSAARKRSEWWQRGLALGMIGVMAQFSLHSFFDNLLVHGLNVQLALLLALSTWPANRERKVVPS